MTESKKLIPVEIMRDVWVHEEGKKEATRIRKGTVVEVDTSDDNVLDGLANGAIRRISEEEKSERAKKAKG